MAFCKNCGAQLQDGSAFCLNCGIALGTQPDADEGVNTIVQDPQIIQQMHQQQMQQRMQQSQMQQPRPMQPQMQQPQMQQPQMQQPQMQQPRPMQPKPHGAGVAFMPDHTAKFDPNDIAKSKGMNVFAYFGVLALIPAIVCKGSKFSRFHINQGLLVFFLSYIFDVTMRIFYSFFRTIAPTDGFPFYDASNIILIIMGVILGGIIAAYIVLGIVNTLTGKAKELPLIGKFHIAD